MNQKKSTILSTKGALLYSFGILGVQMLMGCVNTFHIEFLRVYTALDAKVFLVSAFIILAAKLLSCLADPIIGSMIDNARFKGGKMRPFIAISALPLAILTVVLFVAIPFERLGGAGKYVMYTYITITTALWNVAMSLADIPSQGILALLSPHAHERNKAAGISNTFKSVGLSAPGVLMTVTSTALGKIKEDVSKSTVYLVTAMVVALLGTVLYMIIYWCNREAVVKREQQAVGFREMFGELRQNKNMRIVFWGYLLGFARNMSMCIMVQAGVVLLAHSVNVPVLSYVGDTKILGELDPAINASWLLGLTSAVVSALSLVLTPFINKKWGERKTFIVLALVTGVIGLAAFVVYVCFPAGHPCRDGLPALWFVWGVQAAVSFMYGTHNYIPTVQTADILEYQEWKTGTRKDGVDYAILSMSHKVAGGLALAVGVFLVGLSNYGNQDVTPKMQNIVFLAYIGLPAISSIASTIPMFGYKIDAETKQQMRAELQQRRQAAAEQEAGNAL